uniref:Transmembrane protein n=1 Tax=Elaeophora elaphi TaxID=1147741 RepID=A0A0R3RKN0_9BILA
MIARLIALPAIFTASSIFLWILICSAPARSSPSSSVVVNWKPPWNLLNDFANFTATAKLFRTYKDQHFSYVTTLFIFVYIYKQTFAIPGSFVLNLIAGALFDVWIGFLLVSILTTVGSTLCYLFSESFAREYVFYYLGHCVIYLQQKVHNNSHRLLAFLLFARLFPISPSWLLNIAAPFLNIPLFIFAMTTFIGLAPYNYTCVQAGHILSEFHSWADIFSFSTLFKLSLLSLLPLIYAFYIKPRNQVGMAEKDQIGKVLII